jgi:Rieske Fe-S protein
MLTRRPFRPRALLHCREVSFTRRQFLKVVPAAALVAGCSGSTGGGVGSPDGGTITLNFADFPPLATVGGGVVQPNGLPIVVIRTSETMAIALSAICTHQQCPLMYAQGSLELICNCHNARFALTGAVVYGPPKMTLPTFPASVGADGITVVVQL